MAEKRGLPWILLANLFIAIEYSMLMPTGFHYIATMGGSEFFYGYCVAMYPIGRICFLMFFGTWSDRSGFRAPFFVANLTGVVGGLLYGSASAIGSKECALVGRFISGCGATLPLSAWAARSYPPKQRPKLEQMQKSMQMVGVIFGPAVNALFDKLDVSVGPVDFNAYTMAGYFPAIMSMTLLLGFLFAVDEPPPASPPARSSEPYKRLAATGAWVCMFIAFHTNLQLAAVDTIFAPITSKQLGWTVPQNSLAFAILALCSLFGAVAGIVSLSRGVKSLTIIKIGSVLNLIFCVAVVASVRQAPGTVEMPLLLVSCLLTFWCCVLYTGIIGGLFQQACGQSQGLLGALYTMAFAAGRPVGAVLGGALLEGHQWPFLIAMPGFIVLALVLVQAFGPRLQRAEEQAMLDLRTSDASSVLRPDTCGEEDSSPCAILSMAPTGEAVSTH